MSLKEPVHVVGGGLAGSEAAWQLARAGIPSVLHEMRPLRATPAHVTAGLAELVCSNSFRSDDAENNAVGLLHEEMRRCGSLILRAADQSRVPAGGALAVDRHGFSAAVEAALIGEPLIELRRQEIAGLPPAAWDSVIIATGPLTSPSLAEAVRMLTGDKTEFHDWEKDTPYFEACLPIEVMAARGLDTLRWGPMKPVGLRDPRRPTGAYAVVQLRQDNALGTLYNMVGFQTKLKHVEQKRIFRLIPGLEQAEFARFGGLHRNTFLNSPRLLDRALRLQAMPRLRFAGQITGVEGYVESAAIGLLAGRFAAAERRGEAVVPPPPSTALGALLQHITGGADAKSFQPMNINFGLFPPLPEGAVTRANRGERKPLLARRALNDLDGWLGARAAAE